MCKHRILEGVNIDGNWLETLGLEEQAIQDRIQATTDDFACTIERLKRTPGNPNLLRYAYELVRFIQSDDSFCFMDMEPDTYIEMMLAGANLMELYRAVKYIRLSYTDDRTVESDSVGNQRRMIDDFIAKHPEIEAVAEKVDDGYSGVLFDRPAFQEMMEMIRRGEVNCVIVKDFSRFGRNSIEKGYFIGGCWLQRSRNFTQVVCAKYPNSGPVSRHPGKTPAGCFPLRGRLVEYDRSSDACRRAVHRRLYSGKNRCPGNWQRFHTKKDRSEWFILPDHHEPIVSGDLFETANAKIKRFLIPNEAPGQYPLRGKVYCGYCAHAMNRANGRWFVCPYRKGYSRPGCTGLSIRVSELEQIVFDSIRCQMTAALGMDTETSDFEVQSCKQAEVEKQLQSIRQRKRELYERFVAGEISQEEYKTAKQNCDHEAQMLQNTLRMLAARQQEIQENLEAIVRYNALREEVLSSGSLTQAIAEKIIKKVTVYHDHQIEIEYTVHDFLKDGCGTGIESTEEKSFVTSLT